MLFRLNPSSRPLKFIAHKNTINEVSISPLGHLIASCSDDSTIKLWKNNIHGFSHLIKIHNAPVKSVNFSPSGKGYYATKANMQAFFGQKAFLAVGTSAGW